MNVRFGRVRSGYPPSMFRSSRTIALAIPLLAMLVATGEWSRLRQYCETDVIATYLAGQLWQGAERGTAELAIESWSRLALGISRSTASR